LTSTVPKAESRQMRPRNVALVSSCLVLLLLAGLAFWRLAPPLAYVRQGTVGVVLSRYSQYGFRQAVLPPGLRLLIPGERVILYPTVPMSVTTSLGAPARDGRNVGFDMNIEYSIDPGQVLLVHIQWQTRYATDLVEPLARGTAREAVAGLWPGQVVMGPHDQVERTIVAQLGPLLLDQGIILNTLTISNPRFEEP